MQGSFGDVYIIMMVQFCLFVFVLSIAALEHSEEKLNTPMSYLYCVQE